MLNVAPIGNTNALAVVLGSEVAIRVATWATALINTMSFTNCGPKWVLVVLPPFLPVMIEGGFRRVPQQFG